MSGALGAGAITIEALSWLVQLIKAVPPIDPATVQADAQAAVNAWNAVVSVFQAGRVPTQDEWDQALRDMDAVHAAVQATAGQDVQTSEPEPIPVPPMAPIVQPEPAPGPEPTQDPPQTDGEQPAGVQPVVLGSAPLGSHRINPMALGMRVRRPGESADPGKIG